MFINIDEIIEIQGTVIADLQKVQNNEGNPQKKGKYNNQIENDERFLNEIKGLLSDLGVLEQQSGKRFKSMKSIVADANDEIQKMNDEILIHSFDKGVRPALEQLLSWAFESTEGYQYSFIVNKQLLIVPGKEDIVCFEPTYAIEDFYKNMLRSLGRDNAICESILDFLISHNYVYSYDEKCGIDLFPDKYSI